MIVICVQSGTVAASYAGVDKSVTLSVRPIQVKSLVLSPNPVTHGSTVTATVTLECAAAPGNITVSVGSSSTAIATTNVSSIMILKGNSTFIVGKAPLTVLLGTVARPFVARAFGLLIAPELDPVFG